MFLRYNTRYKDGKEHRYWNIVESKRCAGGKVVQRQDTRGLAANEDIRRRYLAM